MTVETKTQEEKETKASSSPTKIRGRIPNRRNTHRKTGRGNDRPNQKEDIRDVDISRNDEKGTNSNRSIDEKSKYRPRARHHSGRRGGRGTGRGRGYSRGDRRSKDSRKGQRNHKDQHSDKKCNTSDGENSISEDFQIDTNTNTSTDYAINEKTPKNAAIENDCTNNTMPIQNDISSDGSNKPVHLEQRTTSKKKSVEAKERKSPTKNKNHKGKKEKNNRKKSKGKDKEMSILSKDKSLPRTKKFTESVSTEKKSDTCDSQDFESKESLSTTSILKSLPSVEVSITSSSSVQMKRTVSTHSLPGLPTSILGASCESGVKSKKKSSKKKSKNQSDTSKKGAQKFNRKVRTCVENSDPVTLSELLRDPENRKYALTNMTLESVLKAQIMAAMFDDALYCLRNCTLPATLSPAQMERIFTCLPQNLRNSSAFTAADTIEALCIATDFSHPFYRAYILRIVKGIALEFLQDATSARDRICSIPCGKLVRSADCVVNATIRRGKKPTDLVVYPGHQLGVFVPDTMENRGMQTGDAVGILPYVNSYPFSAESLDRNLIEATVVGIQPMVLRLQDKTNVQLYNMLTHQDESNVYRIDKLANRMVFNRQLSTAIAIVSHGLEEIANQRDNRRPTADLIHAITAMDENIDMDIISDPRIKAYNASTHGTHENALKTANTAQLCSKAVSWNEEENEEHEYDEDSIRSTSRLLLDRYRALDGLNESQRLAVEGAVTNRLSLVQGPPGTGKTAVAIRIIQHWAKLNFVHKKNCPILATSDSNIAVDNLVEGCASVGLRVVRLGRPESIRPELLPYCVDRSPNSYSASAFKEKLNTIKYAEVICCTCIGSGTDILDSLTFERVLVDEATQATEPAVLVPLARGAKQLVLVGDHCQLPPTVLSTMAEEEGLGVPLFSRMVACGVPPFMLDTQYRMHPAIAMFPSDLFYGGKLKSGVSAPERRPLAGFPWPREEFPVAFVPVNGAEVDDGGSKYNEAEAAAACDAVEALLEGGQCTPLDIAVVTPYAAQVRLIRRMTRKLVQRPPYVEVSSTDGFQGREKEAVVFSAVRSNDAGVVGFLKDWRRVNVSFTRARRALIVIGNEVCLRRGDPDTWMPWLAWADAHGINMDRPGIPRGRYDADQLRRVRGGTTAAEMLKDVLTRQKAQKELTADHLRKAEKKSEGHIVVDIEEEEAKEDIIAKQTSIQEDLAALANEDGCWDDSDED